MGALGIAPSLILTFLGIAVLDTVLLIAPFVFLVTRLEQALMAERHVRVHLEERVVERSQHLAHVNAELVHADAQKGRWLAARRERAVEVVHDLKAEIAGVKAVSELLITDLEDAALPPALYDEHRVKIDLHIDALVARVQTMLTAAALESDQLPIHFLPTDLGALARQVYTRQEARCRQSGATLRLVILSGAGLVALCDPTHVERIVINLVDNALKFSSTVRPHPHITIQVEPLHDTVAICVADDGPGIADIDAVRQRWARVASEVEGTGLGLSFCNALAHQMHGRLDLTSTLGVGTTATLVLPALHAPNT